MNLGCGGNVLVGWLNVDLYPTLGATRMDGSRRWPFADHTFDAALCEHMIEHVPKALALHMLHEAFRTLRPGAYLRVITPDLNWFARRILEAATPQEEAYLDFLDRFGKRKGTSWCDAINLCFYEHGHKYIWSTEELAGALAKIGFIDFTVTRASQPVQPVFLGAEGHPKVIGLEMDALEAFAIEARKPPAAR